MAEQQHIRVNFKRLATGACLFLPLSVRRALPTTVCSTYGWIYICSYGLQHSSNRATTLLCSRDGYRTHEPLAAKLIKCLWAHVRRDLFRHLLERLLQIRKTLGIKNWCWWADKNKLSINLGLNYIHIHIWLQFIIWNFAQLLHNFLPN